MMEALAEIKKIGWATDGGSSGMNEWRFNG